MPSASGFQICPVAHLPVMALRNAPEALALHVENLKELPRSRSLTELRADPDVAQDIKDYMFALIALPAQAHAAE